MEPFGVDGDVEALNMAPPGLLVGLRVVVAKTYSNNVIRTKSVFDGPDDRCLGLPLQQVVGDEGRAYPKLRRVAKAAVSGDVY